MTWALAGNDQTLALAIADALLNFWIARGLLLEGIHWYETSLSFQLEPSQLVISAWISMAQLQQMLGELHTSIESVKMAISLANRSGHTNLLLEARSVWARSLNRLGQFEEMYELCQETMKMPQGPLFRAVTLSWLGQAEFMVNRDLVSATNHFEESLKILRVQGSVSGVALVVSGLSQVAAERKDFEAARACIQEALSITKKIGNRFGYSLHTITLGRIELLAGNFELAREILQRALVLSQDLAASRDIGYIQIQLGHVAVALKNLTEAKVFLVQALKLARERGDYRLQLESLMGFANIYYSEHQFKTAAQYLGLALGHQQSNHEIRSHGQITLMALEQHLEPAILETTMRQGLERGLDTTVTMLLSIESKEPIEA